MNNSLSGFLQNPPAPYTLTTKYRGAVEVMRTYFKTHPDTRVSVISKEDMYLFRGDLTTLLKKYQIPVEDHYLIMRVNDITSIHDTDIKLDSLLVPSQPTIERFKTMYKQANPQ